jgi:hypothetical protein
MPWPEQPPFDEIGSYRVEIGADGYERLARLARTVIAEPEPEGRYADTGGESIRIDRTERSWSPRERSPAAEAFVGTVRQTITAARDSPFAVVRAQFSDGGHVALSNRGDHPLPVRDGEIRRGWGPADHPPSPLRLAGADPTAVDLPAELEPGARLKIPLGAAPSITDEDFATPYALVSLTWRPNVREERLELEGWMIAGPGS